VKVGRLKVWAEKANKLKTKMNKPKHRLWQIKVKIRRSQIAALAQNRALVKL